MGVNFRILSESNCIIPRNHSVLKVVHLYEGCSTFHKVRVRNCELFTKGLSNDSLESGHRVVGRDTSYSISNAFMRFTGM